MQIVGMLRVKNEARWIERSLSSILPVCDRVLVMDDHSTDDTPALCAAFPRVTVIDSPFADLDECRDKNWLLEQVRGADWVLCIDGDEMLNGAQKLVQAMTTDAESVSMRIPYLWDSEDRIRIDGVYGKFRRHSAFRPRDYVYTSATARGFHCGNVPFRARLQATTVDAQLLHFGYLQAADRARKYAWYNAQDPGNQVEDRYRHIAAGLDISHAELIGMQKQFRAESGLAELRQNELLPPAPSEMDRTAHAGPMTFEMFHT